MWRKNIAVIHILFLLNWNMILFFPLSFPPLAYIGKLGTKCRLLAVTKATISSSLPLHFLFLWVHDCTLQYTFPCSKFQGIFKRDQASKNIGKLVLWHVAMILFYFAIRNIGLFDLNIRLTTLMVNADFPITSIEDPFFKSEEETRNPRQHVTIFVE